MATTPKDIRREIAGERTELTEAVADLREELGQAAERGKQVGRVVAALGAAALAFRALRSLRR